MAAELIEFYIPPRHKPSDKITLPSRRGRLLLFMPKDYNVFIEIMTRVNSYRKLAN